jgi:HK97 family phage prohead protease
MIRFETKSIHADIELKTRGQYTELSGLLATWDLDLVGERFAPGAFAASLRAKARWPFLWTHNAAAPLGVIVEARETDAGLFIKAQLSRTQGAADLIEWIRDGVVGGLSVGYQLADFHWDGGEKVLDRADIIEGSAVVMPANPAARIASVGEPGEQRAAPDPALLAIKARVTATLAHDDLRAIRDRFYLVSGRTGRKVG